MDAVGQGSAMYRRCARRVRAQYRDNAVARARALVRLSRAFDAQHGGAGARSAPLPRCAAASPEHPIRRVQVFASRVADELEGPLLLYSRRLALLREANRHGIRRFDANLIIAAVQERFVESQLARTDRSHQSSRLPALLLVVVIQSMILAAVGMLFLA